MCTITKESNFRKMYDNFKEIRMSDIEALRYI